MNLNKQHLYIIQISISDPHRVLVLRRTVPENSSYATVEGLVRSLLRDGYTLCNWHLFNIEPQVGDEEEIIQASCG